MKKVTALLATTLLGGALLTGCGAQGSPAPDNGNTSEYREQTMVIATITVETFPYQAGFEIFKELVEKGSDGKITVDIFAGGQLGQEREINESILEGSVQMGVGAGALAAVVETMNILELPFLIQNQEHLNKIIGTEITDELAKRIEAEGGYKVLEWFSTGDSSIQTSKKRIASPADMQGVKIRSIENPALADALQALGANPTPMPYGEVYTGIQTGVVEGSTLDWGSVETLKIYELISYATSPSSAFLAEPRPVIVSAEYWASLNAAEQKLIQESITEAATQERKLFAQKQQEAIETIKASGVELVDIDLAEFQAALQPTWDKWAKQLDAEDLVKKILELAN